MRGETYSQPPNAHETTTPSAPRLPSAKPSARKVYLCGTNSLLRALKPAPRVQDFRAAKRGKIEHFCEPLPRCIFM